MIRRNDFCTFDIEATGLNTATDRIVQLAVRKVEAATDTTADYLWNCNPGVQMAEEVVAIHGITNEMAAEYLPFAHHALHIWQTLEGCDLLGFNLLNYDIPMLWEEFNRCGIELDLSHVQIIDCGNIFKKKEERTLSAAVQFYLNREHINAHTAAGDVAATAEVFRAQLKKYSDLNAMSMEELAEYSHFDNRLDLAGKIITGADGRPTYNIGKVRGTAVEDDMSFARWMLNKDFSANTKSVIKKILQDIESRMYMVRTMETHEPELSDDDTLWQLW